MLRCGSASRLSGGLARDYGESAERLVCEYCDAASVASPSPGDGLHMAPPEHEKLARALAEKVREICG